MTAGNSIKDLHIKATKLFPEIMFHKDGNLRIKGRIISDHLCEFFSPLFHWVSDCTCRNIRVEVDLDYLNSNGTFLLVELFKRMEANTRILSIDIIWVYEEEDEEHYELGELIREKLQRARFKYLSYA